MKFRGKITDIGCIQHFTRKCCWTVTVVNVVNQKLPSDLAAYCREAVRRKPVEGSRNIHSPPSMYWGRPSRPVHNYSIPVQPGHSSCKSYILESSPILSCILAECPIHPIRYFDSLSVLHNKYTKHDNTFMTINGGKQDHLLILACSVPTPNVQERLPLQNQFLFSIQCLKPSMSSNLDSNQSVYSVTTFLYKICRN